MICWFIKKSHVTCEAKIFLPSTLVFIWIEWLSRVALWSHCWLFCNSVRILCEFLCRSAKTAAKVYAVTFTVVARCSTRSLIQRCVRVCMDCQSFDVIVEIKHCRVSPFGVGFWSFISLSLLSYCWLEVCRRPKYLVRKTQTNLNHYKISYTCRQFSVVNCI